jgi:hypothetical protein
MKVEFIQKGDKVYRRATWDGGKNVAERPVTDDDKWRHKQEWQAFVGEPEPKPAPKKKAAKKPAAKKTKE